MVWPLSKLKWIWLSLMVNINVLFHLIFYIEATLTMQTAPLTFNLSEFTLRIKLNNGTNPNAIERIRLYFPTSVYNANKNITYPDLELSSNLNCSTLYVKIHLTPTPNPISPPTPNPNPNSNPNHQPTFNSFLIFYN